MIDKAFIGFWLILAVGLPLHAAADSPTAAPSAVVAAVAQQASEAENTKAVLDRLHDEMRVLEVSLEKQEVRIAAQDKVIAAQDKVLNAFSAVGSVDASRFGVIATTLGYVMAGFGALVTVIVIFFAFRTKDAAIAAAKIEAEEHLKNYRDEFDKLAQTARSIEADIQKAQHEAEASAKSHLDDIKKMHDDICRMYDKAREYSEHLKSIITEAERRQAPQLPGGIAPQLEPGVQTELAAAAKAAAAQPQSAQGFDEWYVQGLAAYERGEYQDALKFYDKAEDLAPNLLARANLLNSRAVTLCYLKNFEDALDIFNRIVDSYSEYPDLVPVVAKALANKGITLGALDRSAEEIAVYDDLLARFGTATELPLREAVANALFNKGVTLGALDRSAEEIAVYDDVLARFGTATELTLREQVAKALFNKGGRLGVLDRSVEAIAAYDEVLVRFGAATEPLLREAVAKAKAGKERLLKG